MDPATEAYAAAYELRQDALNLQNGEFAISNPTVLECACGLSVWRQARVQVSPPRQMPPILPNSRG